MTRHVFRFFVQGTGSAGGELELAADDRRHVERVLRLRPGDRIELADARGAVWDAALAEEGRARLVALLADAQVQASGCTVWLALAGSRADLAVEKLTELGVAAIGFLRSERGRGAVRPERWERVALAAAKQSKRARPPLLLEPAGVAELVRGAQVVLLDHEAPDAVPFAPAPGATLLVGPEAGWSDGERAAARAAGAPLCHLPGQGVLRSETAAIAAAVLAIASSEPVS